MDDSSGSLTDTIVENDINDWLSRENVMENLKVFFIY